jgi:alpha-galactosidase
MIEDKLNIFMRDIKKELELIHYNQALINRSMIQLKNVFEFLQNSHVEDIRKFLERYGNEDSETEISIREDDSQAESTE